MLNLSLVLEGPVSGGNDCPFPKTWWDERVEEADDGVDEEVHWVKEVERRDDDGDG